MTRYLLAQMKRMLLPEQVRELRFAPPYHWRFDLAWKGEKLAVEIEGHPSHRNERFEPDMIKYDEAVLRGWRLLRVTPDMILDRRAIRLIVRALPGRELPP